MSGYHVGCGLAGIYAGTLNKKGDMWRSKSDVTNECLCASAQYLIQNRILFVFEYKGKKCVLTVQEKGEDHEKDRTSEGTAEDRV